MADKLCRHDGDMTIWYEVVAMHDSLASQAPDHRMLQIKIRCTACGMPFEFDSIPISPGMLWETPTTTPDRLRVNLPIRPGATRLFVQG